MTLELLHTVVAGRPLTEQQAETAMRALLAGESTPVLTASFLTALHTKGETVEELTGFAEKFSQAGAAGRDADEEELPGAVEFHRFQAEIGGLGGHLRKVFLHRDA